MSSRTVSTPSVFYPSSRAERKVDEPVRVLMVARLVDMKDPLANDGTGAMVDCGGVVFRGGRCIRDGAPP